MAAFVDSDIALSVATLDYQPVDAKSIATQARGFVSVDPT
jgi:hypothetical protein